MARLSLYRPEKSNDYKFFDRNIKEMFQVGGTDLFVHKYIGTADSGPSVDLTQPQYDKMDPTNIQDLLFLENRDRKYDANIYSIRGHYSVQNLDFDLSQFGLFLNNDIIFITIHYNTMIELIGRKLMVGDVLELPHLTDYHPLNEAIPVGLRRYYQITDGNFASEGYSNTWYSHLWRIKCEPLVDSQEFSNILSTPLKKDNYLGDWNKTSTYVPGYTVTYGDKTYVVKDGVTSVPPNIPCTDTNYWELSSADNLRDILGRYNTNIKINDAVIAEAARIMPKTGYDRSQLYLVPTTDKQPSVPVSLTSSAEAPIPTRATVQMFYSPGFSTPSPVLNIGAQSRLELLSNSDIDALVSFMKVSLETATLAPERLDTNAGQVEGTTVLALSPVSGPYGTTDNTYSSADQFPTIYFQTSGIIRPNETAIPVTEVIPVDTPDTWFENPGINISEFVDSSEGRFRAFAPNTKVIGIDTDNMLLLIDKPAIALIPGDATITVGSTFTGAPIQQSLMDYRADADPRFTYVKFVSPQSFGYTNGYMIGDGSAPNGLPTGAGITFPSNPSNGDYFLRTDYLPNLLYRYDGSLWIRIGSNVRANGDVTSSSDTQMGSFINNNNVTTLTDGTTIPEQQSLTSALKLIID